MPFDDDAEADNTGFRPPPHPDDRLWRHPSEMREHPIVPVGAPAQGSSPAPRATTDSGREAGGSPGRQRHGRRSGHGGPVRRLSGDRSGRPWGAVAIAGTVGAVAAGVGVAVLGVGERVVERPVTERVALEPSVSVLDAPLAEDAEAADPRAVVPAVVGLAAAEDGEDGAQPVQGSGVIMRDDGIVVTSAALVVAGVAPRVRLSDGSIADAAVVGSDAATGLAVIDLEGDDYTPGVLAGSGQLASGDTAFAMATDPGTGGATTAEGVVGRARRHVGPAGGELDGIRIEGAAGNVALGGPVVDERGAVLGVTTAVDQEEAWYVAPVAVARRVADELVSVGVVRHSWLGVEATDAARPDGSGSGSGDLSSLTSTTGAIDGSTDGSGPGSAGSSGDSDGSDDSSGASDAAGGGSERAGALVGSIAPGSPAADGGLQVGDRIVAVDGHETADMAALMVALRSRAPGERVDVTVDRADGSRVTLVIRLGERPATPAA